MAIKSFECSRKALMMKNRASFYNDGLLVFDFDQELCDSELVCLLFEHRLLAYYSKGFI